MSNMKQLLLIWDGEGSDAYVIDAASEPAAWARASCGIYINGDDIEEDHPIENLNEWLASQTPKDKSEVLVGCFEEVVICGFIP